MLAFEGDIERRFQVEHARFAVPLLRVTIPTGIVIYVGFFFWDLVQPEFDPLVNFGVRFAYAMLAALVLGFTFLRGFERVAQPVLCLLISTGGIGIAVILAAVPDGFVTGISGICMVMMYGFSLLCLQFRYVLTFVVVLLTAVNLLIGLGESSFEQRFVVINANFFMVGFALAGVPFSLFLESTLRNRFAETGTLSGWKPWQLDAVTYGSNATGGVRLFLCYRRVDTADVTGRLRDRLLSAPGIGEVVMDVDTVPVGTDFRAYLGRRIKSCDRMVVMVGPSWTPVTGGAGRLADRRDPVRTEIELALNLGLPVIPVLVGDARMPDAEALPESVRRFADLNAARLRGDPDFDHDFERLVAVLVDFEEADVTETDIVSATVD